MTKKQNHLPNSARKYIRREKARIRRQISDTNEAEENIKEFLAKVAGGLTSREK